MVITLDDRGRFTMPAAIRRQLGIRPRSVVRFDVRDGTVVLTIVTPRDGLGRDSRGSEIAKG